MCSQRSVSYSALYTPTFNRKWSSVLNINAMLQRREQFERQEKSGSDVEDEVRDGISVHRRSVSLRLAATGTAELQTNSWKTRSSWCVCVCVWVHAAWAHCRAVLLRKTRVCRECDGERGSHASRPLDVCFVMRNNLEHLVKLLIFSFTFLVLLI